MPAVLRAGRMPVLLAYAAFALIGVSAGAGGVLLPPQIRDYGVDKATIGLIFFTGSAGFVLASASSGALIHRFGTRLALVLGAGVFVATALVTAMRPSFAVFVLLQVAVGYGIGVQETVLNAYLASLPDATTLLNRLHAFFGVGALIGPLLATWMLGFASWTAVWLVMALLGIPVLVGFRLAYPALDTGADASGSDASGSHASGADASGSDATGADASGADASGADASGADADVPAAEPDRGGLLTAALRQRGILLGAALLAVYVGLEIGVGNWGFSYLVEERGHGDVLAGYTVSGYWLGLTLGRFVLSPAATRLGLTAVGLTYTCMAGVAAAVTLTWLLPGAVVAGAGFVLLGFFLGPIFPTAMAVVPTVTTARLVPTAIGVMNAGSVIGGAALPWLAGAIAQGAGISTLLPFTLALAVVQTVIWWRMSHHIRPTSPDLYALGEDLPAADRSPGQGPCRYRPSSASSNTVSPGCCGSTTQ